MTLVDTMENTDDMALIDELNPVPCPLNDSGHTVSLCFASTMSTYHDINHVQSSPLITLHQGMHEESEALKD